eukprot:214023_1
MQQLKAVLNGRVTADQIQNIDNWKDASEVLSAIGSIMMINASASRVSMQPIDDDTLRNMFTRLTDPSVYGSMEGILKNIRLTFEDCIDSFQTSCWQFQARYS